MQPPGQGMLIPYAMDMSNTADSRPVVVVLRDPDFANEYTTFPGDGDPIVLDVDLGASFNGKPEPEQWAEWKGSMEAAYSESGLTQDHPAYIAYFEAVNSARPEGS